MFEVSDSDLDGSELRIANTQVRRWKQSITLMAFCGIHISAYMNRSLFYEVNRKVSLNIEQPVAHVYGRSKSYVNEGDLTTQTIGHPQSSNA